MITAWFLLATVSARADLKLSCKVAWADENVGDVVASKGDPVVIRVREDWSQGLLVVGLPTNATVDREESVIRLFKGTQSKKSKEWRYRDGYSSGVYNYAISVRKAQTKPFTATVVATEEEGEPAGKLRATCKPGKKTTLGGEVTTEDPTIAIATVEILDNSYMGGSSREVRLVATESVGDETVWEDLIPGHSKKSLAALNAAFSAGSTFLMTLNSLDPEASSDHGLALMASPKKGETWKVPAKTYYYADGEPHYLDVGSAGWEKR